MYYEYAFPDTDAQQAALDKLRVDCLLNLASCKLRTRQYDEVIENCTLVCVHVPAVLVNIVRARDALLCLNARVQALAAEPSNSKALFRRAQAHRHKDDLDDAWNDITAAVRLAPKDKALRSEAAAVQVRVLAGLRD